MSSATKVLRQASQSVSRAHHAPFRIPRTSTPQIQRDFHLARPSPSPFPLRKQLPNTRKANLHHRRQESTASAPRPLTNANQPASEDAEEIAARKAQEPAYDMSFTCRKCLHRSSHRITKQAYHFGTTLVTCPGCKNRHLISDHLKIFSDKNITVEDILKEKGQLLRKGRLGEDGDVEFYDEEGKGKIS